MLMKNREPALSRRSAALDPLASLRHLTTEFDRFFPELFFRRPPRRHSPLEATAWMPEIDVFEKDNTLVTKVDLPGLKKEDVKVELIDGALVISGERKTDAEEKREGFYRCEREYGAFYRSIALPDGVKAADVKATFVDGVLEVSVPLAAQATPDVQKIEIDGEAPTARKPAA